MFAFQCLFCEHGNRASAKFCEDCGTPLNLKPCKHCEAINERTAQSCHLCGTKFVARSIPGQGTAAVTDGDASSATRPVAPRSPRVNLTSARANAPLPVPQPQATYQAVPSRGKGSVGRIRTFRRVLSAVLLAAIAGTAYYLYRQPAHTSLDPTANQRIRSAPVEAHPGGTPAPAAAAPVQPSPGETGVDVHRDQPKSGTCAEAVAALGLCGPSAKKGEGN